MKDIVSLRNHLFDQLNRLAEAHDKDEVDLEIAKASSIVQVSETIIKTAQVENEFIAITKAHGSGFIPVLNKQPSLLELAGKKLTDKKPETELFDVDKEKNWLNADQGKVIEESGGLETHKISDYNPG
jgi:hypothetical protein